MLPTPGAWEWILSYKGSGKSTVPANTRGRPWPRLWVSHAGLLAHGNCKTMNVYCCTSLSLCYCCRTI